MGCMPYGIFAVCWFTYSMKPNRQYATMSIQAKIGGVVNCVTDFKAGTPKTVLDEIFEPFSTASNVQNNIAEPVSSFQGNGETILVADDEDSILTITGDILQTFGYRVLTAKDGADAVAIYTQHKGEIAIVLTDMMMPVMDGAATIHVLKRINPAVKIIASSGIHANGDLAKASGVDSKHFLPKPYTPGALLKIIRSILDEA
jgi:CheY-like chemotaxis protein